MIDFDAKVISFTIYFIVCFSYIAIEHFWKKKKQR